MNSTASLNAWLARIEQRHPQHHVELGLDRIRTVYQRLNIAPHCPVVTLTGTNGKGSTSAMIATILQSAGYRVGLYMSPHLLRYNERIRINDVEASDHALCEAFATVEMARKQDTEIDLTYFEFGTLVAFWLFARTGLDAWVLEVGLGGRFDAVNLIDADVAVVTAIDIDHTNFLGDSRDSIGFEKAGIARAGRVLVCGDHNPPPAFVRALDEIQAKPLYIGRDFGADVLPGDPDHWRFWQQHEQPQTLAIPALPGRHQLDNAAMALTALATLPQFTIDDQARNHGLRSVSLQGRLQIIREEPLILCDVAHNPHAARALNTFFQHFSGDEKTGDGKTGGGKTIALFAMLADKDIEGVARCVRDAVDQWWIAPLPGPRGANAARLREALIADGIDSQSIREFPDIASACREADALLHKADRMLIFGSFITVSEALRYYQTQSRQWGKHD